MVAILVVTSLWGVLNYHEYIAALHDGIASGDYHAAAERLQTLEESDPQLAIYPEERGMLLGLAAAKGDIQAAQEGADSFARYVALEPDYASGWANLAALDEQLGKFDEATNAMNQAALLAPQSWSLVYRAGVDAERAGDISAARSAYEKTLALTSAVALLPDWDQSPIRRALITHESDLSDTPRTLLLLERGDIANAYRLWNKDPESTRALSRSHALSALFALANGDRPSAKVELEAAQRAVVTRSDEAWAHLAAAWFDADQYEEEIAAARNALDTGPTEADWELGSNIAYIQYLHLAIPRVFLPQVGYTEDDILLLHLFGNNDALANLRSITHP